MYSTESKFLEGARSSHGHKKQSKILPEPSQKPLRNNEELLLQVAHSKNRFLRRNPCWGSQVSSPEPGKWDPKYIYIYILESSRALRARLILPWHMTLATITLPPRPHIQTRWVPHHTCTRDDTCKPIQYGKERTATPWSSS